MAWIKIYEELTENGKMQEAAAMLGIEEPHLIGHLVTLWLWVMKNVPSGDLSHASHRSIAKGAQWAGDPDAFVEALLTCSVTGGHGFLERTEDGRLLVHDWDQHGGTAIQTQKANAQRQARYRENHKGDVAQKNNNGDITVTDTLRDGDITPSNASQIEKEKEKEINTKTKDSPQSTASGDVPESCLNDPKVPDTTEAAPEKMATPLS